jgi:hypothetical protein
MCTSMNATFFSVYQIQGDSEINLEKKPVIDDEVIVHFNYFWNFRVFSG